MVSNNQKRNSSEKNNQRFGFIHVLFYLFLFPKKSCMDCYSETKCFCKYVES